MQLPALAPHTGCCAGHDIAADARQAVALRRRFFALANRPALEPDRHRYMKPPTHAHRALPHQHFSWGDGVVVGAVLLAVGAAWYATLSPGVRVEFDVGEMQAVCATRGVAHPTGFPIWTLTCSAFAQVFAVGDVAWRANLFTLLSGLAALVPLFFVQRRLGAPRLLAAAGTVAFAAIPANWRVAVVAEVYQMHLLVMGVAWLGVVQWYESRNELWLWAAVCAACLGIGVHPLMVVTAPGLLLAVLLTDRRAAMRAVPVGALALLLALLPYVWLWTRVRDPDTPFRNVHATDFSTFLHYATGAHFHPVMLTSAPDGVLWRETGLQTASAAGAAAALLLLRARPIRAGMLCAAVLHALFAATYGIEELGPYILPVTWLGVVGAVGATLRAPRLEPLAAGIAVAMLVVNRGAARLEHARQEAHRTEAIAALAPNGVVIVCGWSELGSFWSQQLATEAGGPFPIALCPHDEPEPLRWVQQRLSRLDRLPHQPGSLPPHEPVLFVGKPWATVSPPLEPIADGVYRSPLPHLRFTTGEATHPTP